MKEQITDTFIKDLMRKEKLVTVSDKEQKGFQVRVFSKKSAIFCVRFTFDERRRRYTIGPLGEWSTQDARAKASALRQEAREGTDPAARKQSRREADTVEEFSERYLTERAAPGKLKSAYEYRRVVEKEIVPTFGKLKLATVTRADVSTWHSSYQDRPYSGNRSLAIFKAMFSYAAEVGAVAEIFNPCRLVKPFKEKRRERLLTHDELTKIGEAIREAETVGLDRVPNKDDEEKGKLSEPKKAEEEELPPITEPPAVTLAIRLLALTGCRRNEILRLQWPEVDFKNSCLRLGDSKTGAKVVPLGTAALELLVEAKDAEEPDPKWVCPGKIKGKPIRDLNGPWRRIRHAAELPDLRLHDLRHGYASTAVSQGYATAVIGKALGHARIETTSRYTHAAASPVNDLAESVGSEISAALNRAPSATVEEIGRGKR